jgi:hypothetical protein
MASGEIVAGGSMSFSARICLTWLCNSGSLEGGVGEPQREDVLDRFLPEIAIDVGRLAFAQETEERSRRDHVASCAQDWTPSSPAPVVGTPDQHLM